MDVLKLLLRFSEAHEGGSVWALSFGAEESSDSDDGGDWVKKAMMTKKETKLKATTKRSEREGEGGGLQ